MIYFKKANLNTIELLKELKYQNIKLAHCGFTFEEYKQAGYNINDLVNKGFSKKFKRFNHENLIKAGYTYREIKQYEDI